MSTRPHDSAPGMDPGDPLGVMSDLAADATDLDEALPPPTPVLAAPPASDPRPARQATVVTRPEPEERGLGLAHRGKPATVPPRPTHAYTTNGRIDAWLADWSPFKDVHDLAEVNEAIIRIATAMTDVERIYSEIAAYERTVAAEYEQLRNRAIVQTSGGSEKSRLAYADILVEELKLRLDEARMQRERAERCTRLLRSHLDAVQSISHNVRSVFNKT